MNVMFVKKITVTFLLGFSLGSSKIEDLNIVLTLCPLHSYGGGIWVAKKNSK